MSMLALCFLFLVGGTTLLQSWLMLRQRRAVQRQRDAVPAPFNSLIPLFQYRRIADDSLARLRLKHIGLWLDSGLVLLWSLGGGLALLDAFVRTWHWPALWTGIAVLVSMLLISSLLELPAVLYRAWPAERHSHMVHTHWQEVLREQMLSVVLMLITGLPLGWIVLMLLANGGGYGWLWIWLLWNTFLVMVLWIYPVLLFPLFIPLQPLQNLLIQQRVSHLLQRNGLHDTRILVTSSTQPPVYCNACLTGLGRYRRIICSDSLLQRLTLDEVEAVLAHEIGHCKHYHRLSRLLCVSLVSLLLLWGMDSVMQYPEFYRMLGLSHASDHAAVVMLLLTAPTLTVFLRPAAGWLARRNELQADTFAARQTRPEHLRGALMKLYRQTAEALFPDSLYAAFYDDHPTPAQRVARLDRLMMYPGKSRQAQPAVSSSML